MRLGASPRRECFHTRLAKLIQTDIYRQVESTKSTNVLGCQVQNHFELHNLPVAALSVADSAELHTIKTQRGSKSVNPPKTYQLHFYQPRPCSRRGTTVHGDAIFHGTLLQPPPAGGGRSRPFSSAVFFLPSHKRSRGFLTACLVPRSKREEQFSARDIFRLDYSNSTNHFYCTLSDANTWSWKSYLPHCSPPPNQPSWYPDRFFPGG